jgi:hypothetical protein
MQGTIQPYGDNFAFVISVDDLEHTADKPFCWDMTCPCKGDQTLFTQVQQFITDGLLTVDEATLFYCGRTV